MATDQNLLCFLLYFSEGFYSNRGHSGRCNCGVTAGVLKRNLACSVKTCGKIMQHARSYIMCHINSPVRGFLGFRFFRGMYIEYQKLNSLNRTTLM